MNNNSFLRYASLSLLCLVVICTHPVGASECLAQPTSLSSDNAGDAPSMAISETRFDFGEVDEGSVVSHDFIVKNSGGADLQIMKVSPD